MVKHPEERKKCGNIGRPCATCSHFNLTPVVTPDLGYCYKFCTIQFQYRRDFDCGQWASRETLEGAMEQLVFEMSWQGHALRWRTGTNVGTPTDPRHATPDTRTKAGKASLAEVTRRTNERSAAYTLAYGTGL